MVGEVKRRLGTILAKLGVTFLFSNLEVKELERSR